jgi:hypothetical protein
MRNIELCAGDSPSSSPIGKTEKLPVEVAGKKYLDLLVKISTNLDLPYHAEISRLKSKGSVRDFECVGVDSFIKKNAPEYLNQNYRIRDVAFVLDAKVTIDNLISGIEDGKLSKEELIISGKRLDNAKTALGIGLIRVYSVSGRVTNKSFENLYDSFFYGGTETEVDIATAIELRTKYFDKNNDLNNRTIPVADYYFGYLADQVAA